MSREITNYDIIDTFDENKFQTVLMGIDNSNYQDIVIINKLYKSDSINQLFIDKYKKFSENIVSVTDSDNEFVVINQYEQAALISDFLNDNSLDLNERIRLGKSFLYQICDYEDIDMSLQLIFIQADQLTIKSGLLKFSNYILLKDYKSETTQLDILRAIGKTLEVILQLHREKLTSDLSSLQQFIYKLLKSNDIPNSYNDLYNDFKIIAAMLQEDEIKYTPLFGKDDLVKSSDEDANQMRIPQNIEASIAHIQNAEIEDIKIKYESNVDTSTDDFLDVLDNLEEDEIYLIEDDIDLIEEKPEEVIESITYDYHELGDEGDLIIESLDESDELIEDIVPSEEIIDHTIDQLLKFTEPDPSEEDVKTDDIIENSGPIDQAPTEIQPINDVDSDDLEDASTESLETDTTENEPIEAIVADEVKILENEPEAAETFNEETDIVVEVCNEEETDFSLEDILEDEIDTEPESIEEIIEDEHIDEISNADDDLELESVFAIKEDLIKEAYSEIEAENIEYDFEKITEELVDKIVEMDNQKYYHDENHHSVVLTNDDSDPIQEILDRNDKQYSDLYVSEKKTKKRFLPTFLLFFIVLIVITSLLIYYTSSYT